MVETKVQEYLFSIMKTKLAFQVSLRKNRLPKVIYSMENSKSFPNFQTGVDFQFQNPKPIINYFQLIYNHKAW